MATLASLAMQGRDRRRHLGCFWLAFGEDMHLPTTSVIEDLPLTATGLNPAIVHADKPFQREGCRFGVPNRIPDGLVLNGPLSSQGRGETLNKQSAEEPNLYITQRGGS